MKALGTKIVLRIKPSASPEIEEIVKARLVAKGFNQIYGVDYTETFAPVAHYNSVRLFLAIMASIDYECDSADVITAFLLATLDEEIYIKIPDGYPVNPGDENKVLRLRKSLYGLKQAPFVWNKELDTYLRLIGFRPLESDRCVYVGEFEGATCYLLVYVDDILIATPNRAIMAKLKTKINDKFPIEDSGPLNFFLNINFTRDRPKRTISMHVASKIDNLLESLDMTECIAAKLPADPNEMLTKAMCPTDPAVTSEMAALPFKSVLGKLLHIALTCRPDIMPAVSAAGRYAHNPGPQHWQALLRIARYLKGTRSFVLDLGGIVDSITLNAVFGYSDSDWAGDLDQRRSRTGICIFFGACLIMWASKLQASVALSTCEAEYVALTMTAQDIIWVRAFLSEMGFTQECPTTIFGDNKSSIICAESPKQLSGLRHIDLRDHFIRQRVLEVKDVKLARKATADMTADLFTKQLPYQPFIKHRTTCGLHPL